MESARPPPFTPSYEYGYPSPSPSAPPASELDDELVIPPVPIIALQPSAPPAELEYFEDQLNLIEEETNNLNLALIESELEYILQEILKLDENECDKQCQKTIDKIQPYTVEEFIIKNMNKIFTEK
jgi:hypothetical protein